MCLKIKFKAKKKKKKKKKATYYLYKYQAIHGFYPKKKKKIMITIKDDTEEFAWDPNQIKTKN